MSQSKLFRYELDFTRTLSYVKCNLARLNVLSSELLKITDFKTGCFFTLLLGNSDRARLYEFEAGLILPQNPEIQYLLAEQKTTYSIIPTIHDEVAYFLLEKVKKNKSLACIFDDILRSSNSAFLQENSVRDYFVIHDKEVYYRVEGKKANVECLSKCIERSNANWHSLCILTSDSFKSHKEMSLDQIRNICIHAQLIMVGAYDGEGFVFWERHQESV